MKTLKFTLFALCALAVNGFAAADDVDTSNWPYIFSGVKGDGTEEYPLLIYDVTEWNILATYCSATAADESSTYHEYYGLTGKYIVITDDCYRIGGASSIFIPWNYFNGHLTGYWNNTSTHDLSGNGPNLDSSSYYPLGNDTNYFGAYFCTIGPDGVVEHLTISRDYESDFSLDGGDGEYNGDYVGGVVGRLQGTLNDVTVYKTRFYYSDVAVFYSYGKSNVDNLGGIVGWVDGGTMTNCSYNYHTYFANEYIYKSSSSTITDSSYKLLNINHLGGIAGYMSSGTISNCSYGLSNDFSEVWLWGTEYVGGIVGKMTGGTVKECNSYGTLMTHNNYAGGIVGQLTAGTITDCHSYNATRTKTNDDTGTGVDTQYLYGIIAANYGGGIVGTIDAESLNTTDDDGNTTPTALVDNCTVSSDCLINVGSFADLGDPELDEFTRSSYAGGIVGKSTNGTIRNCTNNATIEGVTYLGGVVGSLEGSNTLTGNVNYGSVTSTNTETISGVDPDGNDSSGVYSYTGGIAGTTQYSSTETYCYTFDSCTNYGTVTVGSGSQRVGGIVSEIFASRNDDDSYNSSITGCYNYGKITGADACAGGIIGVAQAIKIDGCLNASTTVDNTDYSGSVTTSGTGDASTGGIVGKAQRYTSITNCTNSGTIESQGQYIGGVAGCILSYSTLSGSTNSGSVSGGLDSSVTEAYVGGVVGSANGESGAVSVTGCDNTGSVTANGNYLAGVAGRLNYATATNCTNNATITNSYSSSQFTGGIAGIAEGSSTISNSSNSGAISSYGYTGGIAGKANASSIDNCTNTATISATQFVGGISGTNTSATISSCYNYGSITGTSTSTTRVGGISGHVDANVTLRDCYSNGTISGPNYIGGIIGDASGDYNDSEHTITITGCKNEGTVTGTATSTGCVGGIAGKGYHAAFSNNGNTGAISGAYDYTGGIIGYALGITGTYLSLSNCINTGSVTGSGSYTGGICGLMNYADIDNVYNSGTVSGTSYVGGIAGSCAGTSTTYNTVDGSINFGSVSGSSTYVGGIIGYMNYTSIGTTYNTGDINASSNYAGGIVGYVSSGTGTLSEAFNTGAISCTGNYAGGLAGAFNGIISYCYNNSPVSGASNVGGLVGSLTPGGTSYSLSISCSYTSDSISVSSTEGVIGPVIGQEVTSSTSDVTLKKVYYLKYDSYNPSGSITNYITYDEDGEITGFEYGDLTGYKIDDNYFTVLDSNSYPVLTSLSNNDYALAYAAAVVPYVSESIANDRSLSSADTYGAITDWCYLSGYKYGVTWNSDTNTDIANSHKEHENSDKFDKNDQSTWEVTGYTYINGPYDDSYYRADFVITNGVSTILYATSSSYKQTLTTAVTSDESDESDVSDESDESGDILAAAAVRDDDSDSTPSTITTITTSAVTVPTKLTFSTYSNPGNYIGGSDDSDSDSDSDSTADGTGGYTTSEGNGFTSGIDSAQSNAATIVSERYYTTSGALVNEPTCGAKAIYIVVRQLSDGTTQTTKVIK